MDDKNVNSIEMEEAGEAVYLATGEVVRVVNPEVRKRAKKFAKLYLKDYIAFLKSTSSNHMHVEACLLERIDFLNNIVCVTYDDICKETGISRPTVAKIMKEFQNGNFIVSKYGYYLVSPKIIAKGFEGHRMSLVFEYNEVKKEIAEKEVEKKRQEWHEEHDQ